MNNVANDRSAGVLMHFTSLAGPPYTGDIGPAAQRFADFLSRSKQSFWQLLPIQPTGASHGWSPYSSSSSMATNPLLISPELLVDVKEFFFVPIVLTSIAGKNRINSN